MSLTINNFSNNIIYLKKGEVKKLTFTFNVAIEGAEFFFGMKKSKSDSSYALSKQHSDFSVDIVNKKASIILDTSSLEEETKYYAELKTTWSTTSIDKTEDFFIYIKKSVIA